MALGALTVSLALDSAQYTSGLTKAEEQAKRFSDSVKSMAIGSAIGNGIAEFAHKAVDAFKEMTIGAIEAADHLNDLSKKTGIGVETLGGIGFAASQAGGNLETASAAAGKLNKSLAEAAAGNVKAAEAFKVLGINVKDAAGNTKTADVALVELADAFASYADGPEKAALALRIFGKAGADIIPLLDDGGKALKENIEYYERYSGVTAATAEAADKFNDTLGKVNLINKSLGNTIAAELLPVLQTLADAYLSAKENSDSFKIAASALRVTLETLVVVGNTVKETFVDAGDFLGAYAAVAARLAQGDIKGAKAVGEAWRESLDMRRKAEEAFNRSIIKDTSIPQASYSNEGRVATALPRGKPPAPRLSEPNAFREDAAAKMLEHLKEQQAILKQQLAVETPLLESEKERAKFVEMISNLKGKTLTDDQKSLLAAQGKIKAQLDANVALEQQVNFEKKIAEIQKQSDADRKKFLESQAALTADIQRAKTGRQEQYDERLQVFGKGSQALEELRSRQAITKEFQNYQKELDQAATKTDSLGSAEYKKSVEQIKASLAEALAANADYYDALKTKQSDWVNGATQALSNYVDMTKDIAAQTDGAFTHAFQGMEDALTQFVMTGKADFKSLANSIISDIMRIMIRQSITGPLAQSLMGVFSGSPNMSNITGGSGTGGLSGGVPGFATGLDYVPRDNFLARLHKGERVQTATEARRADKGLTVNVTNNTPSQVTTQQRDDGTLEVLISEAHARVARDVASGTGPVASSMKSRGLNLSGNLPRRA